MFKGIWIFFLRFIHASKVTHNLHLGQREKKDDFKGVRAIIEKGGFMKFAVLFLSLFCASQLWARTLRCDIRINNESVWSDTVKTLLGEKAKMTTVSGVTSYITEKPDDQFIVEAFVSQYEIRIYGQGPLKSASDQVGASLWGRDMMLDILCVPLSQN